MRKTFPVVLLVAALAAWQQFGPGFSATGPAPAGPGAAAEATLQRAFDQRLSDLPVAGQGIVSRILSDDRDGSRHQRFILRFSSGQTVLVAHNIDLAPRVEGLRVGDTVAFSGEYEWNDRGGVIHWTHHDPAGRQAGGWLEHAGRRYR